MPVSAELQSPWLQKVSKSIPFVRRRRDVFKALGPGSDVGSATVLSFGSLFTAPYKGSESHVDIHEAPGDQRIQSFIQKIEFLPFVREILEAGKNFKGFKILLFTHFPLFRRLLYSED